jgi:hypothetical protein
VLADSTLRPHDKLVVMALAFHGYGRGGECWPSFDALARETGLSRSSVIRTLERLAQKKRIHRTRRPRPGDRHESNLYRVDVCGGEGVSVTPTWVSARHPNRISTAERSSLSISETASSPPERAPAAAVCEFVPSELVELAERLFHETSRRLVISSLRRLLRELGEQASPDSLARFLRHQAKTRDLRGARAPIVVACNADEFRKWRSRRLPPPEPDDDETPTPVQRSQALAKGAAVVGEWLNASRGRAAPRRSR